LGSKVQSLEWKFSKTKKFNSCNPSTWKVEAGGSQVQGSLGYIAKKRGKEGREERGKLREREGK
jgi:hypothetical protein